MKMKIEMSKVVRAVLIEAFVLAMPAMDKEQAAKLSDEELVEKYAVYVDAEVPQGSRLACPTCGGISDLNLDACPYCGATDEPARDNAPAVPPKPAAAPGPKDQSTPGKTKATKAKKGAAPKPQEDANVAAKTAAAKVDGKPVKGVAIVPKGGDLPEGVTVAKLDKAISEVKELKHAGGVALHNLGTKIREIFDGQLYKARVDNDSGKPKYKSFNDFCEAELGLTSASCYNLMDVVKNFNPKQIEKIGTTKLALLLRAPEEERAALLQRAESGATRKQLGAEVTKARAKKGLTRRDTGRKPTPAGGGRKSEKLTLAQITDKKFTVMLHAKPEKQLKAGETLKPAKRLADVPFGTLELANGVTMYILITDNTSSGQLKAVVEFKRPA